jgi:hypothetical protein
VPSASCTPCTCRAAGRTGGVRLDEQVDDFLLEADLAAERDDLLAHACDHAREPEGADVRLVDPHDLGRRARAHELAHHLPTEVARVLDLAVELAVREQSRAAFAELHVRLRR